MRDLRIAFDDEARALYVTLTDGTVASTMETTPDKVFVDLDSDGEIVGIEVLEVTVDGLPALLHTIEEMLVQTQKSMGRGLALA